MAVGPGKYDKALRRALRSVSRDGGATGLLVVIRGPKGAGFSCQCTLDELQLVPGFLRQMADEIEADVRGSLSQ